MLRRLAGHPVLDFVNTIDPRDGAERVDYLRSFADLLAWAEDAGVVSAAEAQPAAQIAADDPAAAERAFARAIAVREASYAVFAAIAVRRVPPPGALGELESAYRQAISHAHLSAKRSGFFWEVEIGLDLVRWQLARAAVELLESGRLRRVKRCPGSGDCGWLFLDSSKNASRRWCSMEGCGNRAKLRRFLSRHRRGAGQRTRR